MNWKLLDPKQRDCDSLSRLLSEGGWGRDEHCHYVGDNRIRDGKQIICSRLHSLHFESQPTSSHRTSSRWVMTVAGVYYLILLSSHTRIHLTAHSIPKRRELVKEAAKLKTSSELKESFQEQQEYQWTTCPLSHRLLKPPIVSDSGGRLYNKDAILEYLIPSDDPSDMVIRADKHKIVDGRVKGLKDIVEIKFQSEADDKWICPITNKPLGPGVKSAYLVPCGHAFSKIALKEVADTKCLQCGESYTSDNVISILPGSSAEKERLAKRMEALKEEGLSHSLKKASSNGKKRKKHMAEVQNVLGNGVLKNDTTKQAQTSIKNAATASLTAKILAEEEAKTKRRKVERNSNLNSLFASKTKGPMKDSDFMTRGHSVAADSKQ